MLKKITVLAALLLTICLFMSSTSYAAVTVGWARCSVLKVQTTKAGIVNVKLTANNGAFENTWIKVATTMANTALATLFTAISLENDVTVQITDNNGSFLITTVQLEID